MVGEGYEVNFGMLLKNFRIHWQKYCKVHYFFFLDYPGYDLRTWSPIMSWQYCQRLCQALSGCKWFQYGTKKFFVSELNKKEEIRDQQDFLFLFLWKFFVFTIVCFFLLIRIQTVRIDSVEQKTDRETDEAVPLNFLVQNI